MFVPGLSRIPLRARSFATSAPLSALSPLAIPKAEQISANWKGTSATGGTTKNFIGGEFAESKSSEWLDVLDPVRPAGSFPFLPSSGLLDHADITLPRASHHRS